MRYIDKTNKATIYKSRELLLTNSGQYDIILIKKRGIAMKKLLSIFVMFSVVVLFSFSTFVSAAHAGDTLFLEEEYEVIRNMLLDLGMNPYFVERLSENELQRIARARAIRATTQHIAIGGGVQEEMAPMVAPFEPIFPDPEEPEISYSAHYSDEYMSLFLLVIELESGNYLFSAYADWLTMPANYKTDLIGICAEGISITRNTRSGWFDYELRDSNGQEHLYTVNFNDANFHVDTSSAWGGSAATFDLYDSMVANLFYDRQLVNMYIHFEFEGRREYPGLEAYFNVIATYDHMVSDFSVEVGVSVGSGGLGFSITPQTVNKFHRRSVMLEEQIHYVP